MKMNISIKLFSLFQRHFENKRLKLNKESSILNAAAHHHNLNAYHAHNSYATYNPYKHFNNNNNVNLHRQLMNDNPSIYNQNSMTNHLSNMNNSHSNTNHHGSYGSSIISGNGSYQDNPSLVNNFAGTYINHDQNKVI